MKQFKKRERSGDSALLNLLFGQKGRLRMLFMFLALLAGLSGAAESADWNSAVSMTTARYLYTATLLPSGKVLVAGGYDGSAFLSSAELYDPATNTWSSAGSMAATRRGHTATLLPSGKVLVAGGYGSGFLSSAELYDPATNTWSPAGNMTTARWYHTATLLPNGKVLVAGGVGSGSLSSAELYDPATNTWSPAGNMTATRGYYTATLLPNGKVLVAGGVGSTYLSSAELYDSATNTWSPAGSMTAARGYHTATLLPNGKVLLAGGFNGSTYLSSAELYDSATNTWSATGSSLITARYNHTATLLPNGKVLVAGGRNTSYLSSAELYDPATNTWSPAGNMTAARGYHTATLLPNGKVLVAGGFNGSYLSSAELYDSPADTWSSAGSMAAARGYHTATVLSSGKVLVAGGWDSSSALTSAELYDPATNTWSSAGSMTTGRYDHTATLLSNGKVLVAGGHNGSSREASAELYDPATNAWSSAGSLTDARRYFTATLLANGKVLVAGGWDGSSALSSAELYDPATNTWSSAGNMTTVRREHTATLLSDGKVLVAGGWDSGSALSSAEVYDPATNTWSATGSSLITARYNHTATLLSDGKVLIAGGYDSGSAISSAELYDPATDTWSTAGSMTDVRRYYRAVLLSNGKVLVAGGGNGVSYLSGAEVYDPATDTWSSAGSMTTARRYHTVTLLTNGRVLVAGGHNGSYLAGAELYDPGLGFDEAWRPLLSADPAVFVIDNSLTAGGSAFRGAGYAGASGGGTNASESNYPLVQLRSIDNGQVIWLTPSAFSETSYQSATFSDFPRGPALLTFFVNAIPSESKVVLFSEPVQLRQTGQTTSYATGDDGNLQEGVAWPSPRFGDNGDETMTDKLTGLVWPQDGGTPTVGACTGGTMTWQQALDYVACMNTNNYLGHSDWRLPNVTELQSLVNAGRTSSADWLNSEGALNAQSAYYWTSTTVANSTSDAWGVGIGGGGVYPYGKTTNNYVWPVRSGQMDAADAAYPANIRKTGQTTSYSAGDDGDLQRGVTWPDPRFTDNGDGTVTDKLTGLTWLRNANCTDTVGGVAKGSGTLAWANSLTWSNNLADGNCGLTDGSSAGDWRLPNREELFSIVHGGQYSSALWLNSQAFTGVQAASYWSSSTRSLGTGSAWYVQMGGGSLYYIGKTTGYHVWPVKGGGLSGNPTISSDPSSRDFGNVASGSSSPAQTFTITNTGTNNLYIDDITVTGTDADQFVTDNDTCSNTTVAPSGTCTIDATFSPTSDGSKSASLSIPSNASGSPLAVDLNGISDFDPPVTTATPSGYTFGQWTNSGTVTVTLSADDGSGSGVASGYPKYCVDTADTCDPEADGTSGTSLDVTCSSGSTCTQYVRYLSKDNADNAETVKSSQVRQDVSTPPTTTATASGYTFGEWTISGTVSVTLSADDGSGSGPASGYPKYCVDTDDTCDPEAGTSGTSLDVTCAADTICTQYVRYLTKDNAGNTETVKSSQVKQDVPIPTVTTVISSATPADLGSAVTFTATVTPTPTGGTVTFKDGAAAIGGCVDVSVNVGAGQAECETSSLSAGSHTIIAVYSGDDNYAGSTSSGLSQQVNCASAIVVVNNENSGQGSLRQAMADACAGGVITFNGDYTIILASTLTISKDLTIDGDGHSVTISGNNVVRVFTNNPGKTAYLQNLTIRDGRSGDGGGIYNYGTLTLVNSSLSGNMAPGAGGGIFNNGGTVTLVNSSLSGNMAPGAGGGIYNYNGGTVTLTNSSLSGNSANVYGGGIYNYNGGTVTVTNCTLSGNSAANGGGIYNVGTLTLKNSTLSGNSAVNGGYGGGIYNYNGGTVTVTNCTLSGNSAANGGGIYNVGTLTLKNSTLSGNSANVYGGGIRNFSGGILHYANTIIANSPSGGDCVNAGSIGTHINNLVENGSSCLAAPSGDPLLSTLGSYGGPTQTFALLPGSPAIDAGDDATCAAAPVSGFDQRGVARPQGSHCDIGAYEARQLNLTVDKSGTGAGTVTATGIDCGSDCSENYLEQTEVALSAVADTGSTFTGWSGDCSGTVSPLDVLMDGDKTCTATFTLNQYDMTASAPGGHGTISCQSPVDYGTDSICTITPEAGYHLQLLTDDSSAVSGHLVRNGGDLTYTITNVTADHPNIVAVFEEGDSTVELRQTGQTASYATGDDGDLQEGVAWPNPRFTVNTAAPDNGGSVTDNLTGLVWAKDGSTPTVGACTGGTWQQALDYVACLNTNNYLGHNDWRLPNRRELQSLVNGQSSNIAAWLNGQGFSNVQSGYYWSSTTYAPGTTFAWGVSMWDGGVVANGKTNSNYVWPVRTGSGSFGNSVISVSTTGQSTSYAAGDDGDLKAGAIWTSPRFADNSDGTVTDNLTGLVWLKNANCTETVGGVAKGSGTLTWANALTWSNNLADGNCGLSDDSTAGQWRLPNREELESLIHAGQANTATWLNSAGGFGNPFASVQSVNYWSSTTYAPLTTHAWLVSMYDGYVYLHSKTSIYYVWPVRAGSGLFGNSGISPSPSTKDFGTINPGSSSPAQTFTITNNGTNNLYIRAITKTGTNTDQFTVQNDNCSNTTIAPAGTCTVDAIFSPTTGGAKSANLSVPSNAAGSPLLIGFSGTGTQYTLTVDKAGNGSGTVGGGGTYDFGTSHDATAVADTGSTFTGWSGDCTGIDSPYSVTMIDRDMTCTATFTLNEHTLTVDATGTGSGTVGGGGTYGYGTSHNITAEASTGSTFSGWSGDCLGSTSPYSVTMIDRDMTCTATFTLNEHTLTVDKTGTGSGTVGGGGTYGYGTSHNITAQASTGSTFTGWSGDCSGSTSPYSITMLDRDMTCTATFEDTSFPELTVSTLSDGSWTSNETLNVSGEVSDGVSGLQALTVNGNAVTVNPDDTFSTALTLADGPNTITVVATDNANNTMTDTRTINYDPYAPVILIDQPADNSKTASSTTTISGAVDEYSGVTGVTNNSAPAAFNFNDETGEFSSDVSLTYGINTIEVNAEDLAGNTASSARTVTYDNLAPSLSITEPSQDISTDQAQMTIRGTVSDLTIPTVTISIDGGSPETLTVTDGSFEKPVTFSEAKTYVITVTAEDETGNSTTVTRNIIYVIANDTAPDQFTFTNETNAPLNSFVMSGVITISGINAPAQVSISGGNYSVNGGPFTSDPGTVNNGDSIRVMLTSSVDYSTTTSATLTIGGVSGTFSVTTREFNSPPLVLTPDQCASGSNPIAAGNITVNGVSTTNATVGSTVTLTDSSSPDGSLYINWGDGSPMVTPMSSPSTELGGANDHTYGNVGTYHVTQTVRNACGYKAQQFYTVKVTGGSDGKGTMAISGDAITTPFSYHIYEADDTVSITHATVGIGAVREVILDAGIYDVVINLPSGVNPSGTVGHCETHTGVACMVSQDCPVTDYSTNPYTHEACVGGATGSSCHATAGGNACDDQVGLSITCQDVAVTVDDTADAPVEVTISCP